MYAYKVHISHKLHYCSHFSVFSHRSPIIWETSQNSYNFATRGIWSISEELWVLMITTIFLLWWMAQPLKFPVVYYEAPIKPHQEISYGPSHFPDPSCRVARNAQILIQTWRAIFIFKTWINLHLFTLLVEHGSIYHINPPWTVPMTKTKQSRTNLNKKQPLVIWVNAYVFRFSGTIPVSTCPASTGCSRFIGPSALLWASLMAIMALTKFALA